LPSNCPRRCGLRDKAITFGVAIFGGLATYVVTWLVGVTGDPIAFT